MTSRRTGYAGSMDSSPSNSSNSSVHSGNRKQSIINIPERTGVESCYDRKADKAAYGAPQGSVTVTSLKSRLAPTIQSAMSAAVDTLLGEVVLVLNETQQELLHKEQENERLKVRLEVSERELKTLQECLCSAQKLIDQLQISYTGSQSVFAPSLSSMASMTSGMDRDHQNARNVNGAGVDMGLGGSVEDSLHGFEPRDDYKMCQLSIQPDGSVTNHALESFASNASHMCSDSSRPDERQSQGPGGASRFEIKQEQGPNSGSGQTSRKEPGIRDDNRVDDGDLGYVEVGGEGGSQRSFTHPLRHQRPARECGGALQQGGLDEQKQLARTAVGGRVDSASPGRAEDSAGPSVSDTVGEPSGDRPHHCLECGKTFRLISSLKKHIRIHTGEKPYPCGVCGRRFRESGALKTHLRIHTGEKPYSCSECGNCFRHLDGLRKHRRTHTGEKPYVCAICGKRLSRLQHLKHHQLIHTGERPCCCPFCNRSFKEPAALRKHIRTHREEGGHMGVGASDDTDPDAMDDINNLHPAAPSPQMRFGEWGAEEDDSSVVDCV
ncbi:zinc finger protein with KRAB and SCAN domains 8 isoform X1 [Etheostoma cragini]|uniref:zinc finger protein with KRAB and SCAN domains 8 isoform X1 n=2 Tax=Etheostoma cragini TaxID=417921 RepID=UPI00155F176B|nr:zinc finger protein with KRAB and SCAN domains 8 isoform X1 [Etheostoma cragini]